MELYFITWNLFAPIAGISQGRKLYTMESKSLTKRLFKTNSFPRTQ